ncbi:hypothetical protein ACP4OV_019869 [Aristida adscensionis]
MASPHGKEVGAADDAGDGVACTALCMYLPRLSKKKRPVKSTSAKSARKRKASWPWWSWSPCRATSGEVATAAGASTSVAGDGSASFKHWSRSQLSRVTPQRSSSSSSFSVPSSSFSFPVSPASTSSCTSTPKLAPGGKAEEAEQ